MKDVKGVKSILVIVVGLLILYFIFGNQAFLYVSVSVGTISLLVPIVGKGIVWLWYKIAEVLGWVNSRIILSLLYILFLVPIAFLYKLFNKDSLAIKKGDRTTLFSERNHTFEPKDLDNMW